MSDTTKTLSPAARIGLLATAVAATIEPRRATAEPLVEIDAAGKYVPAGRKLGPTPREDGGNGYGLNEQENVAYHAAIARLNKDKPDTETVDGVTSSVHKDPYEFITRHEARFAEGLQGSALAEAVEQWRKDYPLPERFRTLEAGDPSNNIAPTPDEQAEIDRKLAAAAPSSDESTLNAPVRSEVIPAANIPRETTELDVTRAPSTSGVVRTITKSRSEPMTRAEMIEAGLISDKKDSDSDLVTTGASAAVRTGVASLNEATAQQGATIDNSGAPTIVKQRTTSTTPESSSEPERGGLRQPRSTGINDKG